MYCQSLVFNVLKE